MSASRFLQGTEESDRIHQNHCEQLECPEQYLLDTIEFNDIFTDPEILKKSRQIKDLFLKRDFLSIFTNEELLPVYALEHISSRALCYRDVFIKIPELYKVLQSGGKIGLFGAGNGAELLGIASAMYQLDSTIECIVQDLSNYQILDRLLASIHSKYTLKDQLSIRLDTGDLQDVTYLNSLDWISETKLITACFILNELLTNSKKAFVQCIQFLVSKMKKGSFLLVIDSAGSFSEFNVGAKDYMLFTLLDHIQQFKALEKQDSIWYRYPTGLKYPLKLNNMRYFLRLYQKQ